MLNYLPRLLLFFFNFFWYRVSLGSPDSLGTPYVEQEGLELNRVPVPQVVGLEVYTIRSSMP